MLWAKKILLGGFGLMCVACQSLPTAGTISGSQCVGEGYICSRTVQDGPVMRLMVKNLKPHAITLSLSVQTMENLQTSTFFPHVVLLPANTEHEVLALSIIDPQKPTHLRPYFHLQPGNLRAKHAHNAYRLPFAKGQHFTISQGFNDSPTHTGESHYAIDFAMPEGTPVHATREGMVIEVEDTHHLGGNDPDYLTHSNKISILHADGTLGEYAHLAAGSAVVKIGQSVRVGQVIAASGNTGYSSGPHLHFGVYSPIDGYKRRSFPVVFSTDKGNLRAPKKGQKTGH